MFLQVLLVGSNELALFENHQDEEMQQRQVSHEAPVTAALYNSLFNVVVSSCQASTIICWNIDTGEKVIQFKQAHSQIGGTSSRSSLGFHVSNLSMQCLVSLCIKTSSMELSAPHDSE